MGRVTTQDGLSLHYDDAGSGAPVLCLAGLTRNADDFQWLAPHLKDCRLIRMDYRGRGRSDHAPDPMSYSIAQEGHDALALLDHLGLARATLVGTSRGGLIAMTLAATAPQRLAGVVLNDIGPELDPEGLTRIIDYVGRDPGFPDLEAGARGLAEMYARDFPGVPLPRWRAQAAAMWSESPEGGLALRYDPRLREALIAGAGSGAATDLWQMFDALKGIPTAAIRGANSDLLSPETFAAMQARNPDLITATVPDRGHVPFLDEPEALAAIETLLERSA